MPSLIFNLNKKMPSRFSFFFFNDTATTEIFTLSLLDALPISKADFHAFRLTPKSDLRKSILEFAAVHKIKAGSIIERKSTRLNFSHLCISHAVFCLKKKIFEMILLTGTCSAPCCQLHISESVR